MQWSWSSSDPKMQEALADLLTIPPKMWSEWDPVLIADRLALALCLSRDRMALPLARAARRFVKQTAWFQFGYARVEDHARERFGRSGRWVRDLAALADAADRLPGLSEALTGSDGERPIGRVVALMIGRTAALHTCREWIALARKTTVRELREEICKARQAGSSLPMTVASCSPCAGKPQDTDLTGPARALSRQVPGLTDPPSIEGAAEAAGTNTSIGDPLLDNVKGFGLVGAGDRFNTPSAGPDVQTAVMESATSGSCCSSSKSEEILSSGSETIPPAPESPTTAPALESTSTVSVDDDTEVIGTFRYKVPPALAAAFEDARDLHDAITGGHGTLASFVEALIAEAYAGPLPPDDDPRWFRRQLDPAAREALLARASENWKWLWNLVDPDSALVKAESTLHEIDWRCGSGMEALEGDPEAQIRALTRLEDEIERRLGDILAEMGESGAWRGLQFGSLGHYGEERLGISRTAAEDRARLARALRGMPVLREAYQTGRIGQEAASLVRRILGGLESDLEDEVSWVEHAAKSTVKRLRDEHRLVFHGMAATPDRVTAAPPDDAAWHASLKRRPGDSRKRLAQLGRVMLEARSLRADVNRPYAGTIIMRLRLPLELGATLDAAMRSRCNALEQLVRSVPVGDPWPDPDPPLSVLAARTFSIGVSWVPHWIALLALIEDFVETWDDPRLVPKHAADKVYIRDGWRCMAPGCTSREKIEDHHVVYKSRGGNKTALANRLSVCRYHHQQGEHGEFATCHGESPLGVVWWLGRHGIGGSFRNEMKLE